MGLLTDLDLGTGGGDLGEDVEELLLDVFEVGLAVQVFHVGDL